MDWYVILLVCVSLLTLLFLPGTVGWSYASADEKLTLAVSFTSWAEATKSPKAREVPWWFGVASEASNVYLADVEKAKNSPEAFTDLNMDEDALRATLAEYIKPVMGVSKASIILGWQVVYITYKDEPTDVAA